MKKHVRLAVLCLISTLPLSACLRDLDNSYKVPKHAAQGATAGALSGLFYSTATGATGAGPGAVAGAVIGGGAGYLGQSKTGTLLRLQGSGVQIIPYGEQITMVLTSDVIFEPTTDEIRYEAYGTLLDAAAVIKAFRRGDITIAAYGDAVGNIDRGYELTQKQAQSILAFLWSHGIPFRRMHAIGYGRTQEVASNKTSYGSSFNRRVEISIKPSIG